MYIINWLILDHHHLDVFRTPVYLLFGDVRQHQRGGGELQARGVPVQDGEARGPGCSPARWGPGGGSGGGLCTVDGVPGRVLQF